MNYEQLQDDIRQLRKDVNALRINEQRYLKSNTLIPPGIACKVSYDGYGLIVNGTKLESSDIPELPIDHIISLRKILDDKIGSNEFKKLQIEASNNVIKKGNIVGSGIKVNYDHNGLVISTSDLLVDDIPELPIQKIDGLLEKLSLLESHHKTEMVDDNNTITPGIFCKISYDNKGRVISGSNLDINDIPIELINRINSFESMLPMLATGDVVRAIGENVLKKLDSNNPITSGTYTKVTVDSKGLVTKGDKLTVNDLPELTIMDIKNLYTELHNKVNLDTFIALNDTVSTMVNSLKSIGDVNEIKNTVSTKANESDMRLTISQVKELRDKFNILNDKIPNDTIMEQLQQIQLELSTLSGRISVIENKLNIPNNL